MPWNDPGGALWASVSASLPAVLLAFAPALIFVSICITPGLYQPLALRVFAYAIHFLAEAIGLLRTALYKAPRGWRRPPAATCAPLAHFLLCVMGCELWVVSCAS